MKPCTSQSKIPHQPPTPNPSPPKKEKINHYEKKYLYFRKWNFLALILKKFLYSLKRKLFFIFKNGILPFLARALKIKNNPTGKKILYFRKRKH